MPNWAREPGHLPKYSIVGVLELSFATLEQADVEMEGRLPPRGRTARAMARERSRSDPVHNTLKRSGSVAGRDVVALPEKNSQEASRL